MNRKASAAWQGGLKQGKGLLSTESGVLKEAPYSFTTRFEQGVTGTNPEELVGAAHAGCFSMALSAMLEQKGYAPERISTDATVSIEKQGEGWAVTSVQLDLVGIVPGIDEEQFRKIAEEAKAGCPISKLLKADIRLNVTFKTKAAA